MSFLSFGFLAALVGASGPTIIHLLNRRRFRTIDWAAMEFLRAAIQKNKRILELRDLLLLILRTAAIVLFVLAMARPYWSAGANPADRLQPVHAILLIDNSLSMAYTELDRPLLDTARERAADFIRSLPQGSEVSVIPMAERAEEAVRRFYPSGPDALEALDQIQIVDRAARPGDFTQALQKAIKQPGTQPAKVVVILSDMQQGTFASAAMVESFAGVDRVQVVQLGQGRRPNCSVADFRVREGVVDAESPAVLVAQVRNDADEPRSNLRVTLKIDQQVVEEKLLHLEAGQGTELIFKHRFAAAGTAREPIYAIAVLELAADRLALDDTRSLVVPVAAGVPVVFIDQYGRREQPERNRYGETFPLRRLLAPRGAADGRNQLVQARHRAVDDVTRDDLRDARLVVVAGVRSLPAELDALLREYVEQGGQLFIAAGGAFDPTGWNAVSWRDGQGVLPLPFKPDLFGKLPTAANPNVPAFHLDPPSFSDEMVRLEMPDPSFKELLETPFFFLTAGVDATVQEALEQAERARFEERLKALAQSEQQERRWAQAEQSGQLTPAEAQQRDRQRLERQDPGPPWLAWSNPLAPDPWAQPLDRLVARSRPRVIGRYDNGEVFALRRELGKGTVVAVTTGVFPVWNSLATDQSVLLLDRMLRLLLARSLPEFNLGPVPQITIPIESRDLGAQFALRAPGREPVPLAVEALGERAWGVRVRQPVQRGVYRVSRLGEAGGAAGGWTMRFAVAGPAEESDLTPVDRTRLTERLSPLQVRWATANQAITLETVGLRRTDLWPWLLVLALACLVGEMLFLSFERLTRRSGP